MPEGGSERMYINEYGDAGAPKVILLAPMLVSGQELYTIMRPYFEGSYCFIAPDQGGHGRAGAYTGADSEYAGLKAWLRARGYGDIALLYGASMGATVAWRLFNDPAFAVRRTWLDGAALTEKAPFTEWLMRRMFQRRKKQLGRQPAGVPAELARMYGDDFAGRMAGNFKRLSTGEIDAICHACCHYELKKVSADRQRTLHLEYGENDMDYKLSRKALALILPEVRPVLRAGYPHCGYMAGHLREYVQEMERFLKEGQP